jgi:hypothetical protein
MPFPDVFKVFESHSRDMHGMPAALGYSVLVSIEGIQNLISFFLNSYNYSEQNSLFELKAFKCHRNISLSNSWDNTANYTISNNHEQQTEQQESVIEKENGPAKRKENKRQQESVVKRENRPVKQKERRRQAKQQESVVERENRLAKLREKQREKRQPAKQKESVAERENSLAKLKEKINRQNNKKLFQRERIDLQSKERKKPKQNKKKLL